VNGFPACYCGLGGPAAALRWIAAASALAEAADGNLGIVGFIPAVNLVLCYSSTSFACFDVWLEDLHVLPDELACPEADFFICSAAIRF